jgi:ribonuclease HI
MSVFDYGVLFDGGSLGNPGRGYGSYRLERSGSSASVIETFGIEGGIVTNNEAEYLTLIQALHRLNDRVKPENRAQQRVMVIGDSQLVLNQISGKWTVNKSALAALCEAVRGLLAAYRGFDVVWWPREEVVRVLGH